MPNEHIQHTPSENSIETGVEKTASQSSSTASCSEQQPMERDAWLKGSIRRLLCKHKPWIIGVVWCLITAFFIAGLVLKKKTQLSDVLPFIFLYVFVTGRIGLYFISTRSLTSRINSASTYIVDDQLKRRIPWPWVQYTLGAIVFLALALSVSLSLPLSPEYNGGKLARMQSFLGILVITVMLVVTSKHRRHINWRTVIVGYLLQFCLGCIVMKTQWGSDLFTWLANVISGFLAFARFGTRLLFGKSTANHEAIAFTLLPTIIFFASVIQILYYLGGVQWFLRRVGWFFYKVLGTSGAESVVASASPFIGLAESPLLVKDYLEHMTKSELHACMTSGFATISGSMLQAYIVLGVNSKYLITACIMSIPCSLALSKIRYPECEGPLTRGRIALSKREKEANILHAMGNGAAVGIHLSLLIMATLIGMVSLIYAINFLLTWLGQFIGIKELTMELILGYIFYPLPWLIGVPGPDVLNVAQLLGIKTISSELFAYTKLAGTMGQPAIANQLSARGLLIAQFALAGFANGGSIALAIAALGSLAPSRRGDVSRLALSACITGALATMISAAIVSMII